MTCVLPHRFISGRHVKLTRKDGLFRVVDQSSTNGTYVGNVRVFEAEVPLFTSIRLGETELLLEPLSAPKKEHSFQGIIGSDPSARRPMQGSDNSRVNWSKEQNARFDAQEKKGKRPW